MRVFSILRDDVVSAKDFRRWTQRVSFAVAVVMVAWGATILLSKSVTLWFATSAAVWLALLLDSMLWLFRGSFITLAATSLTTTVVACLFSTVQIGATAAQSTGYCWEYYCSRNSFFSLSTPSGRRTMSGNC
jgi:hypothetical protein